MSREQFWLFTLRKRPKRLDGGGVVICAFRPFLGLWLLALGAGAATAHPHVRVSSVSELIYAADGTLTGIRHAWTFDDTFSASALQDVDTKRKADYSREELAPLAQTNVDGLREYGYFTTAKADGKKQRFLEPVDYFLDYHDGRLTLHFLLPVKTPFKARQLSLEIFDPSFFVDFQLAENDPVKLAGAPATCQMNFERPKDGAANAKELDEESFASGGANANYGAKYANRITVDCP
jgi:ABC-type uncharacterized transport system substrate-binding protein